MGYVVGITGHRELTAADRKLIHLVLDELASREHITEFRIGGALGADTEALQALYKSRLKHKTAFVIKVILPATREDQPKEAKKFVSLADEVEELGLDPSLASSYLKRNEVGIVEPSNVIIAFWDGREKSGTAATIRAADKLGIKVVKIHVQGKTQG